MLSGSIALVRDTPDGCSWGGSPEAELNITRIHYRRSDTGQFNGQLRALNRLNVVIFGPHSRLREYVMYVDEPANLGVDRYYLKLATFSVCDSSWNNVMKAFAEHTELADDSLMRVSAEEVDSAFIDAATFFLNSTVLPRFTTARVRSVNVWDSLPWVDSPIERSVNPTSYHTLVRVR